MTELFHEGGWVLAAIVAVSVLAWTFLLLEWLELRDPQARDRLIEELRGGAAKQLAKPGAERTRRAVEELRMRAVRARLRRHLDVIAAAGTVAPLLGLLGTVLGMIHTFEALGIEGGDVDGLTAGVSEALVTTQAGLVVAVPILLPPPCSGAATRPHAGIGTGSGRHGGGSSCLGRRRRAMAVKVCWRWTSLP